MAFNPEIKPTASYSPEVKPPGLQGQFDVGVFDIATFDEENYGYVKEIKPTP